MLSSHAQLLKLREADPNSTDVFEDNVINIYSQRPADLEEVCIYDFVRHYVKCGKDATGRQKYAKLSKANHRLYNPKLKKKTATILSSCSSYPSEMRPA